MANDIRLNDIPLELFVDYFNSSLMDSGATKNLPYMKDGQLCTVNGKLVYQDKYGQLTFLSSYKDAFEVHRDFIRSIKTKTFEDAYKFPSDLNTNNLFIHKYQGKRYIASLIRDGNSEVTDVKHYFSLDSLKTINVYCSDNTLESENLECTCNTKIYTPINTKDKGTRVKLNLVSRTCSFGTDAHELQISYDNNVTLSLDVYTGALKDSKVPGGSNLTCHILSNIMGDYILIGMPSEYFVSSNSAALPGSNFVLKFKDANNQEVSFSGYLHTQANLKYVQFESFKVNVILTTPIDLPKATLKSNASLLKAMRSQAVSAGMISSGFLAGGVSTSRNTISSPTYISNMPVNERLKDIIIPETKIPEETLISSGNTSKENIKNATTNISYLKIPIKINEYIVEQAVAVVKFERNKRTESIIKDTDFEVKIRETPIFPMFSGNDVIYSVNPVAIDVADSVVKSLPLKFSSILKDIPYVSSGDEIERGRCIDDDVFYQSRIDSLKNTLNDILYAKRDEIDIHNLSLKTEGDTELYNYCKGFDSLLKRTSASKTEHNIIIRDLISPENVSSALYVEKNSSGSTSTTKDDGSNVTDTTENIIVKDRPLSQRIAEYKQYPLNSMYKESTLKTSTADYTEGFFNGFNNSLTISNTEHYAYDAESVIDAIVDLIMLFYDTNNAQYLNNIIPTLQNGYYSTFIGPKLDLLKKVSLPNLLNISEKAVYGESDIDAVINKIQEGWRVYGIKLYIQNDTE